MWGDKGQVRLAYLRGIPQGSPSLPHVTPRLCHPPRTGEDLYNISGKPCLNLPVSGRAPAVHLFLFYRLFPDDQIDGFR